jgi:hypothetical protein
MGPVSKTLHVRARVISCLSLFESGEIFMPNPNPGETKNNPCPFCYSRAPSDRDLCSFIYVQSALACSASGLMPSRKRGKNLASPFHSSLKCITHSLTRHIYRHLVSLHNNMDSHRGSQERVWLPPRCMHPTPLFL